jgi:protein gp37
MTKIEWTDESWNPITGCNKISLGCKFCYAERMAKRLVGRCGYPTNDPFKVTLHPDRLEQPLRWRKNRKVFVCSMGDLFHNDVPEDYIAKIFAVMRQGRQHVFQILTKRPERMLRYFSTHAEPEPWIWLGVSVEDQDAADHRIPFLLRMPKSIKFVSVEPLLGPVDLCHIQHNGEFEVNALTGDHGVLRPLRGRSEKTINWVIVGGESGPGARPMNPHWALRIKNQCVNNNIPFFFKQWGEFRGAINGECFSLSDSNVIAIHTAGMTACTKDNPFNPFREGHPGWRMMKRVGKKAAGRILDGQEWNQTP